MDDLSDRSKKLYDYYLDRLRKHFKVPACDVSFLLNPGPVLDHIESLNLALNSKKMFYITIYSYLKRLEDTRFTTEIKKQYKAKMDEYNKRQQEHYETQEMTETEKAKYLHWYEIEEARIKAWNDVEDYFTFQNYLILCLYTMNAPVRLDYANMIVVKEEVEGDTNLFVWNEKDCYFLFREYKTAKRYGAVRIPVSEDLKVVLEYWRENFNPDPYGGFLLYDKYGDSKPMSEANLGQTIIKIFKKFTGKACSLNTLRHSYVNKMREGETPFLEQKKVADSMMHSVGVSVVVYKKN